MSEMFQFDPYLMQKIHFENENFTFFKALQKPFFPQIPNISVNWIEWSNSTLQFQLYIPERMPVRQS